MTTPSPRRTGTSFDAVALLLPGVLAVAMSLAVGQPMSDWDFARSGGERLLDGHLTVYADLPKVQMGPLALVLAGLLPGPAYLALTSALLPVVLWLAVLPLNPTRRTWVYGAVVGMLLAWPWAAFGVQGHVDDALVAGGVVGIICALRLERGTLAVVAFLVAVAAKPTAVLFLPLLFLHSRRLGLTAVVLGGLVWAPFVLSDISGFLAAGQGQGDLWPYSVPDLLGGVPHTGFPDWLRPLQLVSGLAACWFVARHRGPAAAVAAAVTVRVLMEPGTWNYYSSSVVVAALVLDLHRGGRFPWTTGAGLMSFIYAADPPLSSEEGAVRLVCLLAVLGAALLAPARRPASARCPDRPEPVGRPSGHASQTA